MTTPERRTNTGIAERWQAALVAGDADGIAALYEDDAVFYMPTLAILARGPAAIRDAWADIIALGPVASVRVVESHEVIDGDHAYIHHHGVMHGAADNESVSIPFRATAVMHRGSDGVWRYLVDHA